MKEIRKHLGSLAIICGLIASLNVVHAQIWLEMANVSNGQAYLNLHNATNQVYAIWSTTDLLANWNVETEVWPDTNQTVTSFTVPMLERENLFVRAEDWTGMTENGNTTPDWWFWEYFGTTALSDTNLDSFGNLLLADYTNGVDPNSILFSLQFPSDQVNSNIVNGTVTIFGGTPFYMAVLVNDTNEADAFWQPYAGTNITVSLNTGDGVYTVRVGLRGLPDNAQQTWLQTQLTLNSVPFILTVTNPASSVVSQPMIQVQGYASGPFRSLTYDVSNSAGFFTNQTGCLTGEFYETNVLTFTTNFFQCYDIALTNGLNIITLHATDMAGNSTTTNVSLTLDYSSDTTPPVLSLVWPQDGTPISGGNFTLQAQLDDNTATVMAQIVDASGNTNTVQGLVERSGRVWAQNLPLAVGTNILTVTATDAAGNSTTTNLTLVQSGVTVTMDPLNQFNQSSVTVTGTISDPSYDVWVNGVEAYYVDDAGDWEADGVPVSPTGTATFDVEIYVGDPALAGSQNFSQLQPVTISLMSYMSNYHNELTMYYYCPNGPAWGGSYEVKNWLYQSGGVDSWGSGGVDGDCQPDNGSSSTSLAGGYNGISPAWEIKKVAENIYNAPVWIYIYGPDYWFYDKIFGLGSWSDDVHASVMIVPSGPAVAGQSALYLVSAQVMDEDSGQQLPGNELQIRGTTLADVAKGDGSVWSDALVQAPAGVNTEVTPTAAGNYSFNNMQVLDVTHVLAVDANRDGNITFDSADQTTTANPYRFWVNDSQEGGDDESSGGADDQIPGQSYFNANYSLTHVNGSSDLVNFFPVALCLGNVLQWIPPTNGWEYHLTQNDAGLPAGMGNGAVKFVYTSLSPANAFDYLTNTAGFGYGTNSDEWATNADTIQVLNTPGTVLDTNWLAQVQANGGCGVILVEGCAAATQPLMLEIWYNGQKMGGVPLYLSISGVEQMFRHLNFSYVNGTVEVPARSDAPNEPQTNGKNLVFLHGYNVNQQEARGVESEMFKRFHWSGSKAKFYGVTWNGAESKGTFPFYNIFTPNYHTNVVNALQTAASFANYLGTLSGQTVVAAHSLGNMVVLSAISDYNAQPSKYFMIDAAVPMEAIQGDMSYNPNMLYSTWNPYVNRTFASDWWQLFANDYRSTLTWSNRLGNLGTVDIYNFYSGGEEVLREYDSDPPSTVLSGSGTELKLHLWDDLPYGIYAWVWQEKGKGTCQQDWFLGSSHGGWRFPVNEYGDPNPVPPSTANSLPDSTLRQTPIFDFGSYFDSVSGPFPDLALTNTDGSASTYAQVNRDRILSDAIPALTLPVGANFVSSLGATHNFDMSGPNFESGWPLARSSGSEAFKWYHSDFDYVAYPFTYQLFNKIVTLGNLK